MPPLADVQMTTPERNLVLVHTQPFQARAHFEQVRQILRERAPDIEVFIVDNAQTQSVTRRKAAQRPSLVFSPVALDRFRPMRGKLYAEYPHFMRLDQIEPGTVAQVAALGARAGGAADGAPFGSVVEDFYLTNPIARASAVMAECSALASGKLAVAAE